MDTIQVVITFVFNIFIQDDTIYDHTLKNMRTQYLNTGQFFSQYIIFSGQFVLQYNIHTWGDDTCMWYLYPMYATIQYNTYTRALICEGDVFTQFVNTICIIEKIYVYNVYTNDDRSLSFRTIFVNDAYWHDNLLLQ